MRGNIDWMEIRRKTFHIILGILIALTIYYDILKAWMVLAIVVAGIIISAAYILYYIPIIKFFIDIFEREHLKKRFPGKGVIYMLLALLFLMLAFEKDIVMAGMMIWAFGDSTSALVGRHFGRIRHPLNDTRILEGTIAGIIVASIAASLFVHWPYAIIAATIALTIESVEFKLYKDTMDDNFIVPIMGACTLYVLMVIF